MEQETAVPSYLLHIKSIDDDAEDKDKASRVPRVTPLPRTLPLSLC